MNDEVIASHKIRMADKREVKKNVCATHMTRKAFKFSRSFNF